MPIYEYICDDCQEQVNLFFRSFAEVEIKPAVCPLCGSSNLERVISRVAVVHAAGGQTSQAGSGSLDAPDQNDPKALARSWREASRGQDLGKEFNEVGSRLEAGERPESIEKSLRKRFGQKPEVH